MKTVIQFVVLAAIVSILAGCAGAYGPAGMYGAPGYGVGGGDGGGGGGFGGGDGDGDGG